MLGELEKGWKGQENVENVLGYAVRECKVLEEFRTDRQTFQCLKSDWKGVRIGRKRLKGIGMARKWMGGDKMYR